MIQLTAVDGHQFSVYRSEPAGKPKGAVVVVMEIFGVNSHIKKITDEYAADGYLAIAPAMFDRIRPGLDIGYGNENWQFDTDGLMERRIASINEYPIAEAERKFRWLLGRRPDGHPGLSELGL